MDFWQAIWFVIITFAFIAYLMVMFNVLVDIFRDKDLNGWWKAVWVILLICIPFLTALVYLIARGKGMAQRQAATMQNAARAQESYIKNVAASASPADQIASAKKLLDEGTISFEEFEALKAKALQG